MSLWFPTSFLNRPNLKWCVLSQATGPCPDLLCLLIMQFAGLLCVCKPRHLAANSGRAKDSRKPHAEQRKVPTGTHFSSGTLVIVQKALCGAPSTQLMTRRKPPSSRSKMNPCTMSPLHLGHRIDSVFMLKPPEKELEEVVIC